MSKFLLRALPQSTLVKCDIGFWVLGKHTTPSQYAKLTSNEIAKSNPKRVKEHTTSGALNRYVLHEIID